MTTPSQGRHLYYTAPSGIRIPNSAGQLGPMIDVRSAGGYVVAAGSRISDKTYEITSPVPPAPLPEWITVELASKPGPLPEAGSVRCTWPQGTTPYARAALRSEAETVAGPPEGTRNDTLNRAAFNLGQLVAAGQLTASDVTAELSRAAASAGLPDGEIGRTIRNGMTAGTRKPRHPNATLPNAFRCSPRCASRPTALRSVPAWAGLTTTSPVYAGRDGGAVHWIRSTGFEPRRPSSTA